MKIRVTILAMATLISAILISCTKQGDNTRLSKLTINLTDAPASFDAVNIDVIGLQVIINDSIIDLETQKGVYNLLDLVNGKDTLIVDQEVPFGMLSQVRLLLGDNNSIVTEGDSYDLKTPSAQQSGLKLNVHQDFLPGIAYEYTIDFDAGKSIVQTGKGEYILKPVLKVFSNAVSGAIDGIIFPANARPLILAISESNDTSSTFADTLSGKFMFKGLSKGIYDIDFKPLAPFSDTTLKDISVTTGSVTSIDTLKFQ